MIFYDMSAHCNNQLSAVYAPSACREAGVEEGAGGNKAGVNACSTQQAYTHVFSS
jgi:hypothetical protein